MKEGESRLIIKEKKPVGEMSERKRAVS